MKIRVIMIVLLVCVSACEKQETDRAEKPELPRGRSSRAQADRSNKNLFNGDSQAVSARLNHRYSRYKSEHNNQHGIYLQWVRSLIDPSDSQLLRKIKLRHAVQVKGDVSLAEKMEAVEALLSSFEDRKEVASLVFTLEVGRSTDPSTVADALKTISPDLRPSTARAIALHTEYVFKDAEKQARFIVDKMPHDLREEMLYANLSAGDFVKDRDSLIRFELEIANDESYSHEFRQKMTTLIAENYAADDATKAIEYLQTAPLVTDKAWSQAMYNVKSLELTDAYLLKDNASHYAWNFAGANVARALQTANDFPKVIEFIESFSATQRIYLVVGIDGARVAQEEALLYSNLVKDNLNRRDAVHYLQRFLKTNKNLNENQKHQIHNIITNIKSE